MTSAQTVNHALGFVERTREEIKEKIGKDIEEVVKESKISSMAIDDAISKNPELKYYLESNQNNSADEQKTDEQIDRGRNEQMGLYDVPLEEDRQETDYQTEVTASAISAAVSVIDQPDNNDDDSGNLEHNDDDDNNNNDNDVNDNEK